MRTRSRSVTCGTEQARQQLPAILDAVEAGYTTLITRRGREVAAMVPAVAVPRRKSGALLALAGGGRGLWGVNSARTLAKLRDEWNP